MFRFQEKMPYDPDDLALNNKPTKNDAFPNFCHS